MYCKDARIEPDASIKELLMGLQPGATSAPGLSHRKPKEVTYMGKKQV